MRLLSTVFLGIMLVAAGCNKAVVSTTTSEVNYIGSTEGTVTLRAVGYGKTEQEAIRHAEVQAMETILFRGVPGAKDITNALVPDEGKARSEHSSYFAELLKKDRYRTFVMSAITSGAFVRDRKRGNRAAVDVKINLYNLRRDLEQNKVIRKFGF